MSPEKLGKSVSENFKIILTQKKISIPELAGKIDTNRRAVNIFLARLENGIGSLNTICKYANALGVDPHELFYESKLVPREPKKKGEINK